MTPLTRFAQADAVVVAALALCAATTAGTGPAISAGAGCSISCIGTALVTRCPRESNGGDLPAGHDVYAVLQTASDKVRFRVYATVDVRVA